MFLEVLDLRLGGFGIGACDFGSEVWVGVQCLGLGSRLYVVSQSESNAIELRSWTVKAPPLAPPCPPPHPKSVTPSPPFLFLLLRQHRRLKVWLHGLARLSGRVQEGRPAVVDLWPAWCPEGKHKGLSTKVFSRIRGPKARCCTN